MTPENTEALASQPTEGTSPEDTGKEGGVSKSPDSQEPDWKARAEAAEAETAKVRNDLKAEQGRRTRDQMLQELVEDHGVTRQMVTALLKRTASGETDALAGDIATIDQTTAQDKATRTWADNEAEALGAMREAVMDGEKVLLTQADIDAMKPIFKQAQDAQDIGAMWQAVTQAGKLSRIFVQGEADAKLKKQQEETTAEKKARDIKHGIGDMSTGEGSSGGTDVSWEQMQKSTDLKEVMANYTKALAEA